MNNGTANEGNNVSITKDEEWGDAREEISKLIQKGRKFEQLQAENKRLKEDGVKYAILMDTKLGKLEAENEWLKKQHEKAKVNIKALFRRIKKLKGE